MKTKNFTAVIIFFLIYVFESQAQIWEQTNGPYGGRIEKLAVHPSGDLYAGVFDGGLFRSTNNGDSWYCVAFPGEGVHKVFISSSGYIFVGVEHRYVDSLGNNCFGYLQYRSIDSGFTWQQLNILSPSITCFDGDNSGNIYAAFGDFGPNYNYTIFKSTDQGNTWEVWTHHSGTSPNDFLFWDSYIFMSDASNGIHRLINNQWVDVFPAIYGGLGTNCINVTPGGVLLAGTREGLNPGQGVYRSLDSAVTWERVYSAGIENTSVSSIVINSTGTVFASTDNGVFKSTDEGATWIQAGLQNTWIGTLTLTAADELIAGDNFGIHRWNNTIQDWEDINIGLYVDKTFSLAINQSSNSLFAATTAGIFRTTDYGEVWESVLPRHWSMDEGYFYLDRTLFRIPLLYEAQSGMLFLEDGWDLYRSTDNGTTWNISSPPIGNYFSCMIAGLNPGVIFAGGLSNPDWIYSTFFYSSDYGETWSQTLIGGPGGPSVQCLAFNEISDYLFVGTDGSGIYRSTDQGLSWRTFNVGLLNTYVQSLAINSSGHIFIGTRSGVFRSRDEGGNWTSVGLVNDTVFTLVINSLDYILAGTKSGRVYKSIDEGETWLDFTAGLNLTAVRYLIIDDEDFAMAGTNSEGVFRTIHSTVDVENNVNEIPTEFLLSQNYPNPFNPSTKIKYSILPVGTQHAVSVQIKVFDVLGNEIETLVNEEKTAGTYEITWYAEQLPSGVYFYQLKAGDFIQTKKMLLLK